MWVKICGNTRLEDCLLAAELGADAVGFIFAHGKRLVTAEHVASITRKLPASIEKVGVFTSRDAKTIAETAAAASLTTVQIHGAPDRALLEELSGFSSCRTIQVLHWHLDQPVNVQQEAMAAQIAELNRWDLVEALLVDTKTASASGGTGLAFDWSAARTSLQGAQPPVILAGGLRPENVAEAIETLQPWGVDVSSGVEVSPGIKDGEKMRAFIAHAKGQVA